MLDSRPRPEPIRSTRAIRCLDGAHAEPSVEIVVVSPEDPRDERLAPVAERMRQGAIAAIPTETFYGLATSSESASGVGRLNPLKRKAADSPSMLLAADVEQASTVASRVPDVFDKLASTFWPGPLTLVVPAAAWVPGVVRGGTDTVAVRVPGLRLTRRLARLVGRPITGVSANFTGEVPARTAAAVVATFDGEIDYVLDGGTTSGGAPSTIVDISGERPRVLRRGTLPTRSLRPFLPTLAEEPSHAH